MEEKQNPIAQWLDTATKGIRFEPDRRAVLQELADHLEDRTAGLRRSFPDMTEEEARERALSGMGDAREIGTELAKLHKPWLGWLWRGSQALAVGMLLLAVLLIPFGSNLTPWNSAPIRSTVDTRGMRNRYFPPSLAEQDLERCEILALGSGEKEVTVEGYTFSLQRASFVCLEGENYLLFTLRARWTKPWEPLGQDVWKRISVTDSNGNYYEPLEDPCPEGHVRTVFGFGKSGMLWQDCEGQAFLYDDHGHESTADHPDDAEWFQINFDNGNVRFSIPIQWREVAER